MSLDRQPPSITVFVRPYMAILVPSVVILRLPSVTQHRTDDARGPPQFLSTHVGQTRRFYRNTGARPHPLAAIPFTSSGLRFNNQCPRPRSCLPLVTSLPLMNGDENHAENVGSPAEIRQPASKT